tara:strand:+ start:8415 stop:9689 length:1275 start_codon:yes stop_codon:yes gene_type:complete
MNSVLLISIFSFFIQNIIGFLKFKKYINPIALFSILHFFHNWSFSFSKHFNDILLWRADHSLVSYLTMHEVLAINLIGSWTFFLVVILFSKTKNYKTYFKFSNSGIMLTGYYILSLVFFIRFLINFDPTSSYGANQALTSSEAFDPIGRIIFFRIIMCVIYVLSSEISKKAIFSIVFIEICLSLFTFDRKEIAFIAGSIILRFLVNSNINVISALRYFFISFGGFGLMLYIPFYRSTEYLDGFINRLNETFFLIGEYGYQISFYILTLANSEGVQNWTYQLIQSGEMPLLIGKSYLQAFINMFVLRLFQGPTIVNWQGAYHFKTYAYPDVIDQGWDFSFTAEAIQNFGPNFAFISFALLGLLISYLYSTRKKGDLNQTLYLFTWPILSIAFRMDSTSMFRLYSYIIFVYLFFYLTKKIKTTVNN